MLDSFVRANKKYHPQTLLEEWKYQIKNNKMENIANDDFESSSSDESDSEPDSKLDSKPDSEPDNKSDNES